MRVYLHIHSTEEGELPEVVGSYSTECVPVVGQFVSYYLPLGLVHYQVLAVKHDSDAKYNFAETNVDVYVKECDFYQHLKALVTEAESDPVRDSSGCPRC